MNFFYNEQILKKYIKSKLLFKHDTGMDSIGTGNFKYNWSL